MKTKNNKVRKSAKSRLSDLTPKKDARGGKFAPTPPGSVAKFLRPSRAYAALRTARSFYC